MATSQDRKIIAPQPSPETRHFWDAAAEGKLLYKKCATCGQPHFYPRPLCPFCFSDRTEWQEASGQGTIYTYSVMRRAPVPYAIAYVTLAEGPTMMTNIVDCDLDGLKVGQAVKLVFKPSDGGPPVPMFTPA
ncbi:MAG: Zn-ribbon domain-containing OB-fold protein [Alphaproteobacteria bacterium]|nr:Zn-ribbon domain-containing OB-fold protein [Alphaproteobacteria bacterium]MBV9862508.1 Zn-ribbon domain-containing OB-fold protein [Alphaproteobacteria bacterium]